jgi:hypothetical protein
VRKPVLGARCLQRHVERFLNRQPRAQMPYSDNLVFSANYASGSITQYPRRSLLGLGFFVRKSFRTIYSGTNLFTRKLNTKKEKEKERKEREQEQGFILPVGLTLGPILVRSDRAAEPWHSYCPSIFSTTLSINNKVWGYSFIYIINLSCFISLNESPKLNQLPFPNIDTTSACWN